ncbi:MAG: hypothetical protein HYT76_06765 [Deltaproteobacteria bacterium]|nr:hypothetical protein [Deltaproteobacteria bacterium]
MKQLFLAFCALIILVGCGRDQAEIEPVSLEELRSYDIQSLLFEENLEESGTAEIEVHIVDTTTNKSVLCSGQEHGTQIVQRPATTYDDIDANFIQTTGHQITEVREFKFVVVERDSRHCPQALGEYGMKTLGETEILTPEDLGTLELKLKKQNEGHIFLKKRDASPSTAKVSDLANLRLKYVRFQNLTSGEVSQPEVEIHLIDVQTNTILACMGDEQGMDGIDEELVDYDNLFFSFVPTEGVDSNLNLGWLRVVFVERDDGRCPLPFNVHDDRVMSSSRLIDYDTLKKGETLSLSQNVAQFQIADLSFFEQLFSLIPPASFGSLKVISLRPLGILPELPLEFLDPEIEVHLIDAFTQKTIACAVNGLQGVDQNDRLYEGLSAPFEVTWQEAKDPFGPIRVVIVDRDDGKTCPTSTDLTHDDIAAEKTLTYEEMLQGTITFPNSSELLLGF